MGGALRERSSARGTPPLVMCHVSHLYPSGASLYFTFLARQERTTSSSSGGRPRRRPRDAIVAGGGTITHHHAIGRDHAPWMRGRGGRRWASRCCARPRSALDPAGIMNPGKLLPLAPRAGWSDRLAEPLRASLRGALLAVAWSFGIRPRSTDSPECLPFVLLPIGSRDTSM